MQHNNTALHSQEYQAQQLQKKIQLQMSLGIAYGI